jgi:metal-responsive CopG/Arc/MetJ family transcriptional regulator
MATAAKKTRSQMIRELEHSQADKIARAERVTVSNPVSPVSVRLSDALIEALDRIAQEHHRSRGNLIQYALWEYVKANGK